MINPILIIGIPETSLGQAVKTMQEAYKKIEGYNIIVYTHKREDFEFKAIFEKDFEQVEFDDLKNQVSESFAIEEIKGFISNHGIEKLKQILLNYKD